jgi:Spherulation-specific family 4
MEQIIPLYVNWNDKLWKELLTRTPQTIIINPIDGPGPKKWSDRKNWINLIDSLIAKKWKILYYIDVQSAILKNDKWILTRKSKEQLLEEKSIYDLYPKGSGYFLDDYPEKELFSEIQELEKNLIGMIVANPGTVPDKNVISKSEASVFVLHETDGYPKCKAIINKKTLAIVFGEKSNQKLIDQKWDYGVVFENTESGNPFTHLPVKL